MKIGVLQLILGLIVLVSAASLGAILVFIRAPQNFSGAGTLLVPILFSTSLFLLLSSVFTLLGLRFRKKFITPQTKEKIVIIAFREGLLISALALAYFWLFHFQVFKTWTALPLLAIILAAEYFMLVKRKSWILYGHRKNRF